MLDYIDFFGLPGLRLHDLDDDDDVRIYCEDVLNTALVKDIGIRNTQTMVGRDKDIE